MAILPEGYSFEIDNTGKSEWIRELSRFGDATLQQSWDYLETFSGLAKPVRAVLKKNGETVSMAQGKIIKLPGLPFGIVHFIYAPVWRLVTGETTPEILKTMIRAMRQEFSEHRHLLLTIRSYEKEGFHQNSDISAVFFNEGFRLQPAPFYRTILIDLTPSTDDLRKNLKPKWRRNLSKAERKGLILKSGADDSHYKMFRDIHYEMFSRKHPEKWYNPDIDKEWDLFKKVLTEKERSVLVAIYEDKPVAALILAGMGNTGMNFFSATSDLVSSEKLHALYFLQWQAMVWLKENGFTRYDMRGYDPDRFPGVSYFKSGLGGEDVCFAEYRACDSELSRTLIESAEKINFQLNLLKANLNKNNVKKQMETIVSKIRSRK